MLPFSSKKLKSYKVFLFKANASKVFAALPPLHEKAIQNTKCTDCAICCKSYSPTFNPTDRKRIAKHLQMKEKDFMIKYLVQDADGDYVTPTQPCAFLGEDNNCSIYEYRPSDCVRFPYTNENVLMKKPAITLKNAAFCPIVQEVMDNLLEQFYPPKKPSN